LSSAVIGRSYTLQVVSGSKYNFYI